MVAVVRGFRTLLVFLLSSTVFVVHGMENNSTEGDASTCPLQDLIEKGYTKSASQSCDVNILGLVLADDADGAPLQYATEQDQDTLWAGVVQAINEANAEGDDAFPPFVVTSAQALYSNFTLETAARRRELIRCYAFSRYGTCAAFIFTGGGRCSFCRSDNSDGRLRNLLIERKVETVDDDDSYDDGFAILKAKGIDELVSDRLFAILEGSGRPMYSNMTCVSITCDGGDFIDFTGDCEGVEGYDDDDSFDDDEIAEQESSSVVFQGPMVYTVLVCVAVAFGIAS